MIRGMSSFPGRGAALCCWLVAACGDSARADGNDASVQSDADPTPRVGETGEADPLLLTSPLRSCGPATTEGAARIRVATWNVKAARMADLDALAELLREVDPDVVALQELDVGVVRTGGVHQPRVLAEALGYAYAFAVTVPYDGGLYGIGMLSRAGFESVRRWELPNPGEVAEPAINAVACTPGGPIRVVNVHADTDPERGTLNLAHLAELVADDVGAGLSVVGDFNQRPEEAGPRALLRAGLADVFADNPAPTFANQRIDYVLADEPLALRALEARRIETTLSDHHLLVVDFGTLP
jgi:endonuclease/exonuclease/phosphatase family metal-dependent hydrolase